MRNLRFFNFVYYCLVLIMAGTMSAHALEAVEDNVPNAETVGEGRLSFMFWDVYDARLYAPGGTWKDNEPFALSLTYLRDLEGDAIADRSAKEIRNLGFDNEVKLADWHSQMRNIFPDVTEGTTLTGVYTRDKTTIFYKNGEEIGRIKDPRFGEYFFNIWLSRKTSAPDLRADLLGRR